MKRFLLLAGAMMVVASVAHAAAGVNLTWSGTGCYSEDPNTNKAFACTSNTGANTMTASFEPATDQPNFVGVEGLIDMQADGASVPAWWEFFSGGCRPTALSTSADFTTATATTCVDPWSGQAGGGLTAYKTMANFTGVPEVFTAYGARIKVAYAVAVESPLTGGTEYYAYKVTISNTKTAGATGCAGCLTGATLVLNQIRSAESTAGVFQILTDPIANQCVTWQTSGRTCAAVPTHNRSWGQIKSLYR